MLCKYYRRRYKFQIAIVVIIGTFLYFDLFKNKDNIDSKLEVKEPKLNNKNEQKSFRINSKNYIPPASCNGCPGENGKPVFLSVSI
jgi:hypothetical protein